MFFDAKFRSMANMVSFKCEIKYDSVDVGLDQGSFHLPCHYSVFLFGSGRGINPGTPVFTTLLYLTLV